MAESSVMAEKPFRVLKCTLLSPSKVPPEKLEGIGKNLTDCINCIGKPLELENFRDWSNRYWLKYDWDNPSRATPIPVRSQETPVPSFAEFSASVERTEDQEPKDCICLFIGPHPQLPIHDPLLINSNGLYVVCCCKDDEEEAHKSFLVRILDAILAVSTDNLYSVVFLHELDISILSSKYTRSSKLRIVSINCQKNLLNEFEEEAYDVMQHLDLQKLDDFLTKSDSVLLCGAGDEAELEDATLEKLHDLGIIFRQQPTDAKQRLIFKQPKVLHNLLKQVHDLDKPEGKFDVRTIVTNLYTQSMELSKCMCKAQYRNLRHNKKAVLRKLLQSFKLIVTTEDGEKLLSSIPAADDWEPKNISVEPLLIKLNSEMNQLDFQQLVTELYQKIPRAENSVGKMDNSGIAVEKRCLSFAIIGGPGYSISIRMCSDVLIKIKFWCLFSSKRSPVQADLLSCLKLCQPVLRRTIEDTCLAKRPLSLGFHCNECDEFALYQSGRRFLCCGNTTIAMTMSQGIWFKDQLQLCEEDFDIHSIPSSPEKGSPIIPKVKDLDLKNGGSCRSYKVTTAPRAGMDDKIGRGLDILKKYRKGLIDNMKCLGAVLDIEQQANAILHSNGSIDDHLLEILNLYIREKCPTWRDLCTALNDLPCFNNVREKIEKDHS